MKYTQHILFEKIGQQGQEKISKANITILGLGATGTNSAELLARAGVGNLTLIDRDIIEESNLQRQTLFVEEDINNPKALVAKEKLEKINSNIKIKSHFKDINYQTISILKHPDLILDCTDNMSTRFLLDEYCYKNNIPWIYLGIIESTGMLLKIVPKKTPTLKEVLKEINEPLDSCDTSGILNTIAPFASSLQVTEAIKHITSQPATKELLYFDIWKHKVQKIKINKSQNFKYQLSYLNGEKESKAIQLCGTNTFQLRGPKVKLEQLANKLKKIGDVISNQYCIKFNELIIFEDGRVLIKASDEKKAKSLYTKYIGY
ncbi:ThiF family adenylyltransferase [Candidatus Woesearchaeota archaeon]|nr:ThiF family adenylyltransferase [Candidatus Woesearchaeota archaeon]